MSSRFHISPPATCADCRAGRRAIYGPTLETSPEKIAGLRRGTNVFPANKLLLREGEIASLCFTIYSGWACRYRQHGDGRRQILSFLLPGDTVMMECLFYPGLKLACSVKSLTSISVCAFSVTDMVALMRASPEQEEMFSASLHRGVTATNRRLFDLGRRSALGRIAQLILELEDRLQHRDMVKGGRFHFPARQTDIADATGLTVIHVNRLLKILRTKNIIEIDRKHITIKNSAALREIAEEE